MGITDRGVDRNGNGGLIITLINGYRQSINPSLTKITDGGICRNERGANHNTLLL